MPSQVNILGDGLAACCAAHLLVDHGFSVSLRKTGRPKPARLLVSEPTQSLLREIFGAPELFNGASQIRRRIVRWGANAETLELPHSGLIVSEMELLDRLWRRTAIDDAAPSGDCLSPTAWSLVAASDSAALPALRSFGARQASVASVALAPNAPQDACWVESLPDGWLFLLPAGDGHGALIVTGYAPETLIEQSRLVARQISNIDIKPARAFPAFPQILTEVCGPGWLALGSAAMTFDPLCGEGAGHAARVALLAAAVLQAVAKAESRASLLAHYSTRLLQGFLRHLQVCLPFYQSGGSGHFWKNETAALERGIVWAQQRLRHRAPLNFRFSGYQLEPIASGPTVP